jgi:hypothetical protein
MLCKPFRVGGADRRLPLLNVRDRILIAVGSLKAVICCLSDPLDE